MKQKGPIASKKASQLARLVREYGGFFSKVRNYLGLEVPTSVYEVAKRISEQCGWRMVSTKADHFRTIVRFGIEVMKIGTAKQIAKWEEFKAEREKNLSVYQKQRDEADRFNLAYAQKASAQSKPKEPRWRSKAEFNAFYATKEWQEARYRVLKRDGRLCACCKSEKGPFHVDHIKPRFRHPELELDQNNLQVLCADCNMGKGGWDETDWREDDAPKSLEEIDPLLAAFKATMN